MRENHPDPLTDGITEQIAPLDTLGDGSCIRASRLWRPGCGCAQAFCISESCCEMNRFTTPGEKRQRVRRASQARSPESHRVCRLHARCLTDRNSKRSFPDDRTLIKRPADQAESTEAFPFISISQHRKMQNQALLPTTRAMGAVPNRILSGARAVAELMRSAQNRRC
jgi:hypothetical protein